MYCRPEGHTGSHLCHDLHYQRKSSAVEGLSKGQYMKKQRKGEIARVPVSSPTESSSVQVYHDYQKVSFKMYPTENGSHTGRDQVTSHDGSGKMSSVADIVSKDQRYNMNDERVEKSSPWVMDSSIQAYSGPEDNSTDPQETMTETSTLTFVDAHTTEEPAENHSLHGLGMVYLKEFVLIDDDDDGDMSLREKTVTDLSFMDGNAADLVCGRLLSTSSGSVSECKEESPEGPPPQDVETAHENNCCCFCSIL